jgi:hypothetical protein
MEVDMLSTEDIHSLKQRVAEAEARVKSEPPRVEAAKKPDNNVTYSHGLVNINRVVSFTKTDECTIEAREGCDNFLHEEFDAEGVRLLCEHLLKLIDDPPYKE